MLFGCNRDTFHEDTQALVHIKKKDKGYLLIRNGKPFYIKGAAGTGHLKELKTSGANTVRLYDTIHLKQKLDSASNIGLAVIVDIPLPQNRGYNAKFYNEDFDQIKIKIKNLILEYKDHPALLYWNLGNEILYPDFFRRTNFFDDFNSLIEIIKSIDKNHPVSTSIIGGTRRRMASIAIKSPKLDFLSINSFGNINELKGKMESLSYVWDGPYVISEWGINGPWEEDATTWGAPIEKSSTEKASITRQRYKASALKSPKCLGSVYFYWGNKQESTPTWYSIFSQDGYKTQVFNELTNFWKQDGVLYKGPVIAHALLANKTASENIILTPNEKVSMKVLADTSGNNDYVWKLKKKPGLMFIKDSPILPCTLYLKVPQRLLL